MSVRDNFEKHYSEENLDRIYQEYTILSAASGIDNLSHRMFWEIKNNQISSISNKVTSGKFKFTKYKLKLISKGRGKVPREISIPTIRDRIVLRALCEFLIERYNGVVTFDLPQSVINQVSKSLLNGKFDGFIKLDVSNFYPSIKHEELLSRIRRKIRNKEIIKFIHEAIQTPTVIKSTKSDKPESIGVPQGLSISNILSAIYLINIDNAYYKRKDIEFYRYVDDILIFCDRSKAHDISGEIIRKFKKLGLEIHDPEKIPEKSCIGNVGDRLDYLGYKFENGLISAREGSVEKLKESIISIFTGYKYSTLKSKEFLLWRLNLRITGCIFQEKCKGWLFFFSEINDESLLHRLDIFVEKIASRFSVDVAPKKFVRSFYEIKHNKYESNYIPNFDTYTIEQMKDVLISYFNKDISGLAHGQIEYEFKKRLTKQVKDLLTDVQGFGY
ncbi:reverse transcriptase domain-containing protein [Nitrincola sp. MINF-07-Sa-05]|uniref:reverse transcriptase domain-containing protein n=1 Tax=Nitrincola salilacus TaxID=3400273 RepID=UPI003917F422